MEGFLASQSLLLLECGLGSSCVKCDTDTACSTILCLRFGRNVGTCPLVRLGMTMARKITLGTKRKRRCGLMSLVRYLPGS